MRIFKSGQALILFFLLIQAFGCAQKQKLLDSPLVSMSRTYIPKGAVLKSKGNVRGQFCESMTGDKGSIGLFDEAIKKAQRTYKVDFISNAAFWREGSCVTVEGTGQILVADQKEYLPPTIIMPGKTLPRYNPKNGQPQNPKTNR